MSGESPPRILAVATANPHKLREIRAILEPFGIACRGLEAWPELGELQEGCDTFEGNALAKARALHHHTGGLTVADDSGLEVDALGGEPGVHSKRFTPEASAEANNERLLALLEGVEDRRARFRCVLALVGSGGEDLIRGICEGEIGHAPRGEGGFGYDPLFLPVEGAGRTMAELSEAEKNRISHRARAFRQLPRLLRRALERA